MNELVITTAIAALIVSVAAGAAEAATYAYDAKQRLLKVVCSGSINNNAKKQVGLARRDDRSKSECQGVFSEERR